MCSSELGTAMKLLEEEFQILCVISTVYHFVLLVMVSFSVSEYVIAPLDRGTTEHAISLDLGQT